MSRYARKKNKDKSVDDESALSKDPIAPLWIPPPPALGQQLLQAVEYKPLEEKDLFGLKISKRALKNLSPAEIRDLCEVFQTFSRNEPGHLNARELFYAMRALGFNVNEAVCEQYVENESQDYSSKKCININQYLDIIIDKQSSSKDHHDEISTVFKLFDYEKSGTISIDNLRNACIEANLNLADSELRDMIKEADQNGDGLVDEAEFISLMLKTSLY